MIHFYHFSIPHDMARKHAMATDVRTAVDPGYVIKAALHESFGDGAVKPWRLVPDFELYRVVGIVADPKAVKSNTMSRRLGIVSEAIEFAMAPGDVFDLDVAATPIRRFSLDPANPRRQVEASVADAMVEAEGRNRLVIQKDPTEIKLAYGRWLCERVGAEGTGFELVDYPEILSTRPVRHSRRRHADDAIRSVSVPFVHARMSVRVAEVEAVHGFLRQGLRKFKDLGLGAMLPAPVLAEVA